MNRASAPNAPDEPLSLITQARIAAAVTCAVMLAVGALVLEWSLLTIMALFWFETVVFGLIALLKMAIASVATRRVREGVVLLLFCGSVFCFFSYFHLFFVLRIFCGTVHLFDGLDRCALPLLDDFGFRVALSIIGAAAVFDFATWCARLRTHTDVLAVFAGTFGRVAIASVALFAGGLISLALGLPQIAFLLLILLKMFLDLGIALVSNPSTKAL